MIHLEYITHIDIKLISECKLLWLSSKDLKADIGREITVAQHQALNQISCNKNIGNRSRKLLQTMSENLRQNGSHYSSVPNIGKRYIKQRDGVFAQQHFNICKAI